jgi:hypothetical protein
VLIEDGLVARLADDRFVTGTTTGAAAFFQEMQRLGDPVADERGPGQRHRSLVGDEPGRAAAPRLLATLEPRPRAGAFPYLAVRGQVAGRGPGCCGSASSANWATRSTSRPVRRLAVWSAADGRGGGVRPFGVEAQRLLRSKGTSSSARTPTR